MRTIDGSFDPDAVSGLVYHAEQHHALPAQRVQAVNLPRKLIPGCFPKYDPPDWYGYPRCRDMWRPRGFLPLPEQGFCAAPGQCRPSKNG